MSTGSRQPIRWLREHPGPADLLLAAVITAVGVTAHVTGAFNIDDENVDIADPTWWSVVLAVGATLPIAWRRTAPLVTAIGVTFVQVVFTALDFEGTGFLGVLVAVYSLGAHATGRRRSQVVLIVIALIGLLFVAGLIVDELDIEGFVASVVILATAFFLGDNLRRRREAAEAFAERAERAERERTLLAERQVSAERARIARELHDVVAHSVSVMVIHASAARRNLPTSPGAVETALVGIEETGRQTMTELRAILGVLRGPADAESTEHADLSPQPTLADLPSLVDAADDLPIHLSVSGDVTSLPPGVNLTGYRVVQEALTNVRRHAGDVHGVDVTVGVERELLRIEVLDDGRGAAADESSPGFGVIGMHERVAAIGGTISAGPRPGGGWRVVADLPTGSASALTGVAS